MGACKVQNVEDCKKENNRRLFVMCFTLIQLHPQGQLEHKTVLDVRSERGLAVNWRGHTHTQLHCAGSTHTLASQRYFTPFLTV